MIALLERVGGASLEKIGQATAWPKHNIRGFVSTLVKKRHSITCARREDGERMYSIKE